MRHSRLDEAPGSSGHFLSQNRGFEGPKLTYLYHKIADSRMQLGSNLFEIPSMSLKVEISLLVMERRDQFYWQYGFLSLGRTFVSFIAPRAGWITVQNLVQEGPFRGQEIAGARLYVKNLVDLYDKTSCGNAHNLPV